MRRLALLLLSVALLAACPRPRVAGGDVTGGTGGTGGAGPGTAAPDAGAAEPPRVAGQPLLPADGIACAAPACVFHPGVGAYFACTNVSAGACAHFGARCAPADGCMFDPADGRYKQCAAATEGACAAWGAACAPAGGCLFDPRDGLHRSCDQVVDGACARWGASCDPR